MNQRSVRLATDAAVPQFDLARVRLLVGAGATAIGLFATFHWFGLPGADFALFRSRHHDTSVSLPTTIRRHPTDPGHAAARAAARGPLPQRTATKGRGISARPDGAASSKGPVPAPDPIVKSPGPSPAPTGTPPPGSGPGSGSNGQSPPNQTPSPPPPSSPQPPPSPPPPPPPPPAVLLPPVEVPQLPQTPQLPPSPALPAPELPPTTVPGLP
jgi:hypothetical protein